MQSQEQHGILAYLHEHTRTRVALQKDLLEAASSTFRDAASSIADTDAESFVGSYDSTRRFGDLCLDLQPGGKDAFIYYRILSDYCHASGRIPDLYFKSIPGSTELPAYRVQPENALEPRILLFLTAASMVWSARAFTYLSHDKDHRNALRRAARSLLSTTKSNSASTI